MRLSNLKHFVTWVVTYILASLETLAEEVENPFGTDTNDLPLDALTAVIEKDVYEILTNYPDKDYV
ncbi:MAG: bestrophin family ion channel [Actinomycetota bacterium]